MANTGQKVVLTLEQVDDTTGVPTGLTKNNTPGDPDYIAPYTDLTDCPITTSFTCPANIIATGYTNGTAQFEFSLPPNTTNYPGLGRIKIRVMNSVPAEVTNVIFTIPNGVTLNYFSGAVTGLAASTTYTLRIQYLDSSNVLLSGGDCVATSGTFTTNVTP